MNNIDEIMEMLDWNKNEEEQRRGIELAKEIKCINVFMQPYGKNLWENCAKILYDKTDKELQPYLSRLFEWVQDLNWPGALIILERLKKYEKNDVFIMCVNEIKLYAQAVNDEIWLENLNEAMEHS